MADRETQAASPSTRLSQSDMDAAFEAACARTGLAATDQRRLIYKVLAESRDHPTAEAVFLKIRSQAPRLSLATVYRNLRLFAEAGIVDSVATDDSFARFDGNTEPHHHLICRRCGSVADYYAQPLGDFTPPKAALDGFEVQAMKMNFFGICASCCSQQSNTARRKEK
jgi:Fur family peroxide stress response transcriptional regulator